MIYVSLWKQCNFVKIQFIQLKLDDFHISKKTILMRNLFCQNLSVTFQKLSTSKLTISIPKISHYKLNRINNIIIWYSVPENVSLMKAFFFCFLNIFKNPKCDSVLIVLFCRWWLETVMVTRGMKWHIVV